MNCQELMRLLDEGDIRNVPPAKKWELDVHLSQCADCAAEWRVQERIMITPAMRVPTGFVAQCRQLVTAGAARLIVRRRVILFSSLLVMVAAAAVLGWHYGTPAASPTVVAVPVFEAPLSKPAQVQPAAELNPDSSMPQPVATLPTTFTVTVQPLQIKGHDAEGNALAARFRQRVMTLLQAVPNLVLVDAPSVAGAATADYELAMRYSESAVPIRIVGLEVGKSGRKLSASRRDGNADLSALLGTGVPTDVTIYERSSPTDLLESGAHRLVRDLRVHVFPLDAAFEQEQLDRLRNPSERETVRMRALGALLLYAERRGGFSHASADVIRAGGEFAFIWEGPSSYDRGAIWDGLALTASPELVPYLIRGLAESRQTETRLQLVKILTETYRDDPRAQAALAVAAASNDQQTVRMAAKRGSGDSQWREYVVETLGNPALSAMQRLQPIADMAPGAMVTLGTSPRTNMVLEEHQLRELGALVIKIAPDLTAGEIARKALFAAGAMDTPAALNMLLEVADALRAENFLAPSMEAVSVMGVRGVAHSLISTRYSGDPKARAFIEDVARNGNAMEKRDAGRYLEIMDMKSGMGKFRQNPQPAQQPAQ